MQPADLRLGVRTDADLPVNERPAVRAIMTVDEAAGASAPAPQPRATRQLASRSHAEALPSAAASADAAAGEVLVAPWLRIFPASVFI